MLKKILEEISAGNIWGHMEKLTEISPQRLSGTEEEKKTAGYIKEVFESYGLPVQVHELDGLVSFPGHGELKITSPESRAIKCSVFAQIASTLPEGIEGELVYMGSGGEHYYKEKDARGKIVLVDLSYAPPRPEKVRLATAHGAAGAIMVNWGLPENDCLPLGTVKAVWGNPTPDNIGKMPSIPVLGITKAAGEYLIRLLEQGRARVWMRAEATREWRKIYLPAARLEGRKNPEKFVVVGGHYDAWDAGVTCNATGNAVVLELARIFSKYRDQLDRSILFALWPGHETGIMEGSTWFVDNHWDDLNKNAVMYINIDSPGMRDTSRYITYSSAEAVRFHRKVEKELLDVPAVRNRLGKIGDQSFLGIGIPSLWGLSIHSQEEIDRWGGAFLAWWYHSSKDTMDKAGKDVLERDTRVYAGYIWEMCTSRTLPFEFGAVADEISTRLREINSIPGSPLKFGDLIEKAGKFAVLARKLDEAGAGARTDEEVETINETLIRLSRATTWVRSTYCDRYEQDTYGLSYLGKPLPVLGPVEELAGMDPGGQEYNLWLTKLVRERNKVSDVLDSAVWLLENSLEKIKK